MIFLKNFAKGLIYITAIILFFTILALLMVLVFWFGFTNGQPILGAVGMFVPLIVFVAALVASMDLYYDKFEDYINAKLGIK